MIIICQERLINFNAVRYFDQFNNPEGGISVCAIFDAFEYTAEFDQTFSSDALLTIFNTQHYDLILKFETGISELDLGNNVISAIASAFEKNSRVLNLDAELPKIEFKLLKTYLWEAIADRHADGLHFDEQHRLFGPSYIVNEARQQLENEGRLKNVELDNTAESRGGWVSYGF